MRWYWSISCTSMPGQVSGYSRAGLVHSLVICFPSAHPLLFFSSLRLEARVRARLAIATLSTALSLYVAETVLKALEPARTFWSASTKEEQQELVKIAARYGVAYDTRSQLQVVRDMQLKGLRAIPAVYPNGFYSQQPNGSLKSLFAIGGKEIAVLGGMSNRTTVFCNESGDWVTYHSDEHGFHNPPGLWRLPTIDIVVLGDSFAQGACVPSDREFVAVIRRRYPATLNLGNVRHRPVDCAGKSERVRSEVQAQNRALVSLRGERFRGLAEGA